MKYADCKTRKTQPHLDDLSQLMVFVVRILHAISKFSRWRGGGGIVQASLLRSHFMLKKSSVEFYPPPSLRAQVLIEVNHAAFF